MDLLKLATDRSGKLNVFLFLTSQTPYFIEGKLLLEAQRALKAQETEMSKISGDPR